MSNFLNNLVARTLNLAPVVQPRIKSRFEPVNAAAATAPDQSVEVETPAEPHVTTKDVKPRDGDPAPVVVAPQVQPEQSRIDFQQVINTVRNTYVESHEVVQVPVVERIRERVIERAAVVEKAPPRINAEKTDSRIEVSENPKPVASREIEQNPFNSRLNTLEPAPVAREVPVTTPQPIVPRVVTRIEPVPVTPAQRFDRPPAFQTEPTETINVTIGRVDVRAVFSAQAPPAVARTRNSPVNSLDDYLKQRSEGRR